MCATSKEGVKRYGMRLSAKRAGWVTLPLPMAAVGTTAWHYTDAAGLIGMISNEELWASCPSSLNDSTEISHGVAQLKHSWMEVSSHVESHVRNFVEAILDDNLVSKISEKAFVLCASADGDSHSMWQEFGARGRGYSVGINVDHDFAIRLSRKKAIQPALIVNGAVPGWYPVRYEPQAQIEMMRSVLVFTSEVAEMVHTYGDSGTARNAAFACIATAVLTSKRREFNVNSEVRWISTKPDGSEVERFRDGGLRIVPFLPLCGSQESSHSVEPTSPKPLPIVSVVCGPTTELQTAEDGVERLLRRHGYSNVAVSRSLASYRH